MLAAGFFPHMVSDAAMIPPTHIGYREPADNECILWVDKDFNGDSVSVFLDTSLCTASSYTY